MSIVIILRSFKYNAPSFFVVFSFIYSFANRLDWERKQIGWKKSSVWFSNVQMLALFDTALFCVLSKRKDFEIKTINTTTKKYMKMVYIFRCVALIKIIIFRLLSNPSREWEKKKLCNFFVIIVSLCVSNGHACLSLNGQWKFSCFLMCVSSHTWTHKIIKINECRKHRTIYLEHISHTRTHDSVDVCKLIGTEYIVSIQISFELFSREISFVLQLWSDRSKLPKNYIHSQSQTLTSSHMELYFILKQRARKKNLFEQDRICRMSKRSKRAN